MNAVEPSQLPQRFVPAFRQAEAATGMPFDYLVETPRSESSFDASADATTSSARGLFQFIEQTWLSVLSDNGEAMGLGDLSGEIRQRGDGRFVVPDAEAREAILALRDDPEVAAVMAGFLAQDNRGALEARLQRSVSEGELYIAHVMGPAGAAHLIETAEIDPDRRAAIEFPRAAEANPGLFYTRSGQARSVSELVERLSSGFGTTALAALAAPAGATPAASDLLAARGLYQPAASSEGFAMPMGYDSLYSGGAQRVESLFSELTDGAGTINLADVPVPSDATGAAAPAANPAAPDAAVPGTAATAPERAAEALFRQQGLGADLFAYARASALYFGEG